MRSNVNDWFILRACVCRRQCTTFTSIWLHLSPFECVLDRNVYPTLRLFSFVCHICVPFFFLVSTLVRATWMLFSFFIFIFFIRPSFLFITNQDSIRMCREYFVRIRRKKAKKNFTLNRHRVRCDVSDRVRVCVCVLCAQREPSRFETHSYGFQFRYFLCSRTFLSIIQASSCCYWAHLKRSKSIASSTAMRIWNAARHRRRVRSVVGEKGHIEYYFGWLWIYSLRVFFIFAFRLLLLILLFLAKPYRKDKTTFSGE